VAVLVLVAVVAGGHAAMRVGVRGGPAVASGGHRDVWQHHASASTGRCGDRGHWQAQPSLNAAVRDCCRRCRGRVRVGAAARVCDWMRRFPVRLPVPIARPRC